MIIRKKLIKFDQINKERMNVPISDGMNFDQIDVKPFSIVIPFSSARLESLKFSLDRLNRCVGIDKCEIVLVLYQNEFVDHDFAEYSNLNLNIVHSKRNNDQNLFCLSHARNIGLKQATHDWTLMMDADIICPENMCKVLSHPMMRNVNCIYCTDRINFASREDLVQVDEKKILGVDNSFVGFFHFFCKKRIDDLVGGYDETMLSWGREDCDLMMRSQMFGMKVIHLKNNLPVYHVVHDYDTVEWKIEGSDERNHTKQILNALTKTLRMKDVGNIIQ